MEHYGALFNLGAALLWALGFCLFKKYGGSYSGSTLNAIKNNVGLIFFSLAILLSGSSLPLEGKTWLLMVSSGLIGVGLGDSLMFSAMKHIGVQLTLTIQCLVPLLAGAFGWYFLDEWLTLQECVGVILCSVAVAIIVARGRAGRDHLRDTPTKLIVVGVIMSLAAALSQAGGVILARQGMQDLDPMVGAFLRVLPAAIILLPWLRYLPQKAPDKQGPNMPWLLIASFLGTFIGILLACLGVKYSKAGIAAAIQYSMPIWAVPLSWLILSERSDWKNVTLTVLAVLGVVMVVAYR